MQFIQEFHSRITALFTGGE